MSRIKLIGEDTTGILLVFGAKAALGVGIIELLFYW